MTISHIVAIAIVVILELATIQYFGCTIAKLHESLDDMTKELTQAKNGAYNERDRLVALLAAIYHSTMVHNVEEDEDGKWGICYIDTPAGQLSWHIPEREYDLFAHIDFCQSVPWDGHSTEEKYKRIESMTSGPISATDHMVSKAEAIDTLDIRILPLWLSMRSIGHDSDTMAKIMGMLDLAKDMDIITLDMYNEYLNDVMVTCPGHEDGMATEDCYYCTIVNNLTNRT